MQMFNFSRLVALLLVLVNVSLALSPKQFNKERLKYKDSIIDLNDRNWEDYWPILKNHTW